MSRKIPIIAAVWFFLAFPVDAKIVKYVTDEGQIWYVNRAESVPEKYQDQVDDKISSRTTRVKKERKKVSDYDKALIDNVRENILETPSNQVEIFVKDNCGKCKFLETFLKARKVDYVLYNIDRGGEEKAKFDVLGKTEVPLVKIGQEVITGFSPDRILQLLPVK